MSCDKRFLLVPRPDHPVMLVGVVCQSEIREIPLEITFSLINKEYCTEFRFLHLNFAIFHSFYIPPANYAHNLNLTENNPFRVRRLYFKNLTA